MAYSLQLGSFQHDTYDKNIDTVSCKNKHDSKPFKKVKFKNSRPDVLDADNY